MNRRALQLAPSAETTERDPVCGMLVARDTPHRYTSEGKEYFFCCPRCVDEFRRNPDKYSPRAGAMTDVGAARVQSTPAAGVDWTCPMHPEIVRDAPGSCPICGMALEPRTITSEEV